jgi:cysteine desulfurase/selenocysteine lyase
MDPLDLRADMSALDDVTYLNTGAASPAPRTVVEAATDEIERQQYVAPAEEGMYPALFGALDDARETIADFLGAAPDEIALTESTADGITRIAAALPWQEGDVVVRTDCEHSAGILPWERLRDLYGIEIRVLETHHGRLDLDAVRETVADADLLCLSSITWNYGTQLPVAEIVDIAHDADARVLVDAVQSPGQVNMDVTEWGADFAVGAGHKWLCGPWGAGFLYVSEDATAALEPERLGYRSVAEPDAEKYAFAAGARRLEVGTTSPAPHAGLQAAIDCIESISLDTIEDRIERLTDRLKAGLDDEELLSPRAYESGLVTIAVDDPEATVERLSAAGIRIRSLPSPAAVRASVHAFNTAEDIDALLDQL